MFVTPANAGFQFLLSPGPRFRAGDDILLDQPAREFRDTFDLVSYRPQLLVEQHSAELPRLFLKRHLEVLLPEEARVGEAGREDAAIAFDDRCAAVVRGDIRDADERRRETAV